jgi:sarcosine oxidase gamma subunit
MRNTRSDGVRLESPLVGRSRDERHALMRRYRRARARSLVISTCAAMPRTIGFYGSRPGYRRCVAARAQHDARFGKRTVCWLCPSEWLIMFRLPTSRASMTSCGTDCARSSHRSSRLAGSDGVFAAGGQRARPPCAGCPLDLPSSFSVGNARRHTWRKCPCCCADYGRPRGGRAAQLPPQPLAWLEDRRQLTRHRGEGSVRVTATSVSIQDRPHGAYAKGPIDR